MFKSLVNTSFNKLTAKDIPLLVKMEKSSNPIKIEYDDFNDIILEATSGDKKVVLLECTGYAEEEKVNPFTRYYRNIFNIDVESNHMEQVTFMMLQQDGNNVNIIIKTMFDSQGGRTVTEMNKINDNEYDVTITYFMVDDNSEDLDIHNGWIRDNQYKP